jgi:hypothetical protein
MEEEEEEDGRAEGKGRICIVQDKPQGIGYQLWPAGVAMANLVLDPSVCKHKASTPSIHSLNLHGPATSDTISILSPSLLLLLLLFPRTASILPHSMAQPLSSLHFLQSDLAAMVKGKGVLELGSGCGVVGMAAAMAGASSVTLTDQAEVGPRVQGPGFQSRLVSWNSGIWIWAPRVGVTRV